MVLAPTRYHNPWVGSGVSQPEGLLSVKAPCLGAFTASLPPATDLTTTYRSVSCSPFANNWDREEAPPLHRLGPTRLAV